MWRTCVQSGTAVLLKWLRPSADALLCSHTRTAQLISPCRSMNILNQKHSMAFTAATTRRVLYEDNQAGFLYPIGNTPAKAVVPAGDLAADCRVLLLGCGDVRNALKTAAALHAAGCRAAEVHLNDISDVILARNVILLQAASSIDCSKPNDVAFLWAIWFNACLDQQQHQKLDCLLQQAIQGELHGSIHLADACCRSTDSSQESLLQRLTRIWKEWLGCNKLPQTVEQERKSFMLSAINRRQAAESASNKSRSWSEAAELASAKGLLDKWVLDAEELPENMQDSIAAEPKEYFLHGSITADGSAGTGESVNPTLLDQHCKWRVHDGTCAFDSFPQFTHQQLFATPTLTNTPGLPTRGKQPSPRSHPQQPPGLLTRAAQAVLQQMIEGYQAAVSGGSDSKGDNGRRSLQIVLHGGDGLELCSARSSSLEDEQFHAIDASNMGDHVDLLNLLVCVSPRLLPDDQARLTVDAMTWPTSKAQSITEYLSMALGGPPSLLPTLLGLRLCTDTRFGKLDPYTKLDRMAYRASNNRLLVFAPAAPSAAAAAAAAAGKSPGAPAIAAARDVGDPSLAAPVIELPLETGGVGAIASNSSRKTSNMGLAAALRSLQQLCCATLSGVYTHDRSGLIMHTPATLARLVANMVLTGRAKLRLNAQGSTAAGIDNGHIGSQQISSVGNLNDSGSSSSGEGVWGQLRIIPALLPFDAPFQPAWEAAWQQILLQAPAASILTPTVESNGETHQDTAEQQQQQQESVSHHGLLLFSGTMQPIGLHNTATPIVRLLLISKQAAAALEQSSSSRSSRLPQALLQQLLPFVMPAADALCEALQNDKELPAAAAAGGVAVVDHVVVSCDEEQAGAKPMKVSFLLPANHGFDPLTTTVCLIQQQIGTLHCIPVNLSTFQQQLLTTLPPLLLAQSPPPAAAAPLKIKSSPSTDLDINASKPAIHLVSCVESAPEYTATLRVTGDMVCSGLSVVPTPMVEPSGVIQPSVSHEVTFSISQPVGTHPMRLKLLHPVETDTASYKFSRASRTITARLPKSLDPDWPCDVLHPTGIPNSSIHPSSGSKAASKRAARAATAGQKEVGGSGGLGLISRVDVERDLLEVALGHPQWGLWMSEMFDHSEIVKQMLEGDSELGDPFRDLRETIKIFFIRAVKEQIFIHQIIDTSVPEDSDATHAMYIRIHPPLRRLPNGRPLAVLSVVDNVLGLKLLQGNKIDMRTEVKRFKEVIVNAGQSSSTFCTPAELKLLRALLVRNARRMQPTKWQARNLPLSSSPTHWMASYITLVYPEVLGDSKTLFDAIPELEKNRNAPGSSRAVRTAAAAAVAQMREQTSSSAAAGTSRAARSLSAGSARAATAEDLLRKFTSSSMGEEAAGPTHEKCPSATAAAAAVEESCVVCGARKGTGVGEVPKLMRCSKCRSPDDRYCSAACQKADWSRHKKACKTSW